ncbi:MAG: CoB--CoM heterodisulfide reductase iron-sulfur subunit A family protein [Candidatus Abyssobacteria bacterium SURF_17]|uniref:CoB--CoM heterodisulfide reductase iron-sulfur subunit A family protein n=1 Tax=Candidatus Abyssobacteria bacterium SURF_17 TaxID=2093361 RepID=A0A419F057_9BACT|nr:MAG: CoB--CoM heterodisulfide reductase iron-sulfur subunit A family protein [Candidatus Abyssubacteria bacterium SURF_17]
MTEESTVGTVLVVGAGIAGIKSALELAETGYKVILTDNSPHIGGILQKLDHQFPSDHCGMCRMLPLIGRENASQHCMRKSLFHDNIEILPFTEVKSVQGDEGAYAVELVRQPRYVNTDICNGLGACIDVCPVEAPDEFNNGLTMRKAIYQPVPHNVPQMLLVDMQVCTKCGECVKVCPSNAINLEAQEESRTVDVNAIILAAGSALYDPATDEDAAAYTVSKDVVTSLTFERILSGSGTYDGVIRRPSDGKAAKRIAWIQCVGSRNRRQGRDYCSSICCMFALKEAVLAHEKGGPDIETTIFYMDMRTFGKDFYQYREKAEEQYGVRLVRCRAQSVLREADGTLLVRYLDPASGEFKHGAFDMVVLSTGQAPFKEHEKLAKLLGVKVSASGLLPVMDFEKVKLTKPGVFICGSLMGLTDISEAITSGVAAAGEASKLLTSVGVKTVEEEPVLERPVDREQPLVAVILCSCKGVKTPEGFDLEPLTSAIESIHGVGEVHVVDSPCREEGHQELQEILERTKCNRLLLGACLPYVYRQKLRRIARAAGFLPSLVEVFDLMNLARHGLPGANGIDWVHLATVEMRAAVEKLKLAEALHVHNLPIQQSALVVGGGVAGMRAAISLAERGVEVHLVEKSGQLGGHAGSDLHYTVDGLDPIGLATGLKQALEGQKNITVHLNTEVVSTKGAIGCFTTTVRNGDGGEVSTLQHGAVILATGGREGRTSEYGYGQSEKILTQVELEKRLAAGEIDAGSLGNVVMIQCVGSREKGAREYCSRICCAAALKNAFKILEKNPETRIYILNRDMMTYGFLEKYYTKARGEGIIFINYDLGQKPEVQIADDKPVVKFTDPVLQMPLEVTADLLVLATGIEPSPSNKELAEIFGVPLNQDGFFAEADSKWRPVEFKKLGIYLAGTAHSPLPLGETIMQAEAAAHKAYAYLSRRTIQTARVVSKVHDAICARCQVCVEICPYNARAYDKDLNCIVVDSAACQACGLCAVACPNKAAEVPGWSEKQTLAVIDAKLWGDRSKQRAGKEVVA